MWTLHHGDCIPNMAEMPAESVHLIFADPPYNIGKASWDKIPDYLEWSETWIAEASRVLKPNGAFWVSHSEPKVLCRISDIIESRGRGLVNWVTWDKYNGNPTKQAMGGPMIGLTMQGGLRSWQDLAEYLIYHAHNPMPECLREYRERAGLTRNQVDLACGNVCKKGLYVGRGTGLCYRWEAGDCLPTESQWATLSKLLGLERSHEELFGSRYTFNQSGGASSVWQIAPAPRNGHPTPKPVPLLERIISTCTNRGDLILDPFAGSGTTLVAAERLGRDSIGIEMSAEYCGIIRSRLEQEVLDLSV